MTDQVDSLTRCIVKVARTLAGDGSKKQVASFAHLPTPPGMAQNPTRPSIGWFAACCLVVQVGCWVYGHCSLVGWPSG